MGLALILGALRTGRASALPALDTLLDLKIRSAPPRSSKSLSGHSPRHARSLPIDALPPAVALVGSPSPSSPPSTPGLIPPPTTRRAFASSSFPCFPSRGRPSSAAGRRAFAHCFCHRARSSRARARCASAAARRSARCSAWRRRSSAMRASRANGWVRRGAGRSRPGWGAGEWAGSWDGGEGRGERGADDGRDGAPSVGDADVAGGRAAGGPDGDGAAGPDWIWARREGCGVMLAGGCAAWSAAASAGTVASCAAAAACCCRCCFSRACSFSYALLTRALWMSSLLVFWTAPSSVGGGAEEAGDALSYLFVCADRRAGGRGPERSLCAAWRLANCCRRSTMQLLQPSCPVD